MSRIIENLLQPIGFVWLVHLCLTIHSIRRKRWRPAALFAGIALLLFLAGSTRLPGILLATLETPYRDIQIDDLPESDAIVMLGGSLSASDQDPLRFSAESAFDRALAAVRVLRAGKAPVLAIGGGGPLDESDASRTEAGLISRWVADWELSDAEIIRLPGSRNTYDEAVHVRRLMAERNWTRVILVTSAWHLPRSIALFESQGVPCIPFACDFAGTVEADSKRGFNPVPSPMGFQILSLYLHEKIGFAYYRLRGWIQPAAARSARSTAD